MSAITDEAIVRAAMHGTIRIERVAAVGGTYCAVRDGIGLITVVREQEMQAIFTRLGITLEQEPRRLNDEDNLRALPDQDWNTMSSDRIDYWASLAYVFALPIPETLTDPLRRQLWEVVQQRQQRNDAQSGTGA